MAYYAKDGFRAQMDNFVLTAVALNETYRNKSHISNPSYNTNAITNILVDHNPEKDKTEPGSRKGLMNVIAKSKFLNINYFRSVTDGVNQAVRNMIRNYLNNNGLFNLTNGGGDEDLRSYYLKDDDGKYIIGDDGFRVRNPEIDWNKSINKLRYFTDDKALDQIEKSLDMVVDLSKDQRFTRFIKKTVTAMNNYLIVKYIEKVHKDEDRVINRDEAIAEGVFQVSLNDEDIDKIIEFLSSEDEDGKVWHKKFFDFIKDTGLNDIEKFYNFDANEWLETINPEKMQENMDELNTKLIKFFDMNIKESIVDGMYKIKKDAYDVPTGFKAGEIVYGLGKYVAADATDPDAFESNGKYFRYIDIATYIDVEKEKDRPDI